jgi:hypothetical protein
MKLLMRVWPGSHRFLQDGGGFTLGLCGFILALEVVGRFTSSDFQDLLGLLALAAAAIALLVRHRRTPLPWLVRLMHRLDRWAGRFIHWQYGLGIDLRGEPALPQRWPRWVLLLSTALVLWAVVAGLLWYLAPTQGWRLLGWYGSYTVYLAGLGILWLILLCITFCGVYVPVHLLDRLLKRRLGDPDRRGIELAIVVAYAVVISALAWEVPPGWVLLANIGLLGINAVALGLVRRDEVAVVWQSRQGLAALPLRRLLILIAFLLLLVTANLLVTACGGRLWGAPLVQEALPLTGLLGAVAAWLLPGLWTVGFMLYYFARQRDPARRTPPTVHLSGDDPITLARAALLIRRWGWYVRRQPTPAQPGDLQLKLVPPHLSRAHEFNPPWPLEVALEDLDNPLVRDRLLRRDAIIVRRHLFHGLRKLFKRLATFRGPTEGTLWLAPHWWFIEAAGREETDPHSEEGRASFIGPPYHAVLTQRARQHAHAVLRATQIDLIFVEEGVSFKHVERVLRILTELYDVHGGRRRAEDIHFRGLPKVRVMIHDYAPGQPFTHELYPEPRYLDLSRLRALHIFKDRGGEEEPLYPPYDHSHTPAPSLLV